MSLKRARAALGGLMVCFREICHPLETSEVPRVYPAALIRDHTRRRSDRRRKVSLRLANRPDAVVMCREEYCFARPLVHCHYVPTPQLNKFEVRCLIECARPYLETEGLCADTLTLAVRSDGEESGVVVHCHCSDAYRSRCFETLRRLRVRLQQEILTLPAV